MQAQNSSCRKSLPHRLHWVSACTAQAEVLGISDPGEISTKDTETPNRMAESNQNCRHPTASLGLGGGWGGGVWDSAFPLGLVHAMAHLYGSQHGRSRMAGGRVSKSVQQGGRWVVEMEVRIISRALNG